MVERVPIVAVPAVVVAGLAWWSGAYFPETWGVVLVLEAIVLAVVAIVALDVAVPRRGTFVVGGLLAFGAWQLLSRSWAVAPDAAVLEAERTLLYAGAVATALLTVSRAGVDRLVLGVLLGAGAATVGGLAEHVLRSGTPNDRLDLPVGYTNAAGILATTTLVLGLGLAADGPRPRRALGAWLATPAAAALYLSLSRGALLVCALGLVVLACTVRPGDRLVRMTLAALPAGLAAAGAASVGSFGAPGVSFGEVVSLIGLGILAVAAAGIAAADAVVRVPRPPVAAVVAVLALVLAGVVGVGVHEIREVRSTPATLQGAPDRLFSSSTSDRSTYWDVAARMVGDEPLLGEGAGSYTRVWLQERPRLAFVRDAHNLYLETLAELGPLGLAALLVALLVPLGAARSAARDPVARAALAAYVALLAHATLDWDWELPAVTLCTLLLGVALVVGPATSPARAWSGTRRVALLAAALALGLAAIVVRTGNEAIAQAHDALDRGDAVAARNEADRARRFAPWSAEPWRLLGEAEAAAGRLALGRIHIGRAIREDPRSWESWLALAFATEGRDRARAVAAARRLNPLAPELEAFATPDP